MNIIKDEQKQNIIFIIVSIICIILSFFKQTINNFDLSWIAIILCGLPIVYEAIKGLITEFDIKADILVSIAIVASILIGELFAAGEIATIMAIGGFLEEYTVGKTQNQINNLISKTPKIATLIENNKEKIIPIKDIEFGNVLKVKPGEIIPIDGIIIEGSSSINQSILTGESLPVDKTIDDEVYGGTINQYGYFLMKAYDKSSIEKLINLVKTTSPENTKIVKTADKWATWIVIIAFLVSILTYFITGEIIRSVTVLVVFCPCALILATPTAIMAAIGSFSKNGILIKNGQTIEQLNKVNNFIFDKTGTLTKGKLEVVDVIAIEDKELLIKLITSLENKSEHPIGIAITNYYNGELFEVENFKMELSKGISGIINNKPIICGNKEFIQSFNIDINLEIPNSNSTVIYCAYDGKFLGCVILADTLRNETKGVIQELKNLNIDSTLLTGDNKNTARYIAKESGIKNIKYDCLPEDKIKEISKLQKQQKIVAMIGDGINDAPALKKANIGIAMGDIGSDVSIDASDITLINGNLENLIYLIKLSKKTIKTINRGIGFSLILNFLAMGLAVLGLLGPIVGALIHNIGSVIVVIYSASLLS